MREASLEINCQSQCSKKQSSKSTSTSHTPKTFGNNFKFTVTTDKTYQKLVVRNWPNKTVLTMQPKQVSTQPMQSWNETLWLTVRSKLRSCFLKSSWIFHRTNRTLSLRWVHVRRSIPASSQNEAASKTLASGRSHSARINPSLAWLAKVYLKLFRIARSKRTPISTESPLQLTD